MAGRKGRKLRKNTRKDYAKMADGGSVHSDDEVPLKDVNIDGDIDEGNGGELANNVNKNIETSHEHEDSTDENNHGDVSLVDDDSCSSASDGELKKAEERLKAVKKERKRLLKKNKLEQVARQTKEVEKSLKKLKSGGRDSSDGSRKNKKVDIKSLRAMDDVVEKVDRLMEKNSLKTKTKAAPLSESSSVSESESSSSCSSAGSVSDVDWGQEKDKKKKKKTSEEKTNENSGKQW